MYEISSTILDLSINKPVWKKIDKEVIMEPFETRGMTTSEHHDKFHCLCEDQPTEEARVLLYESNGNLEIVPRPILEDEIVDESEVFSIAKCRRFN